MVDVRRWLRDDRDTPFAERLARDRAIGRRLAERDPLRRVLAWWRDVRRGEAGNAGGGQATLGQRVAAARRLASGALTVVGLLLGAGVAGVAFGYDGRYPVNLFTLLGVLVGLPFVMLVFTLLLIPGRMPGLGALQAVAAGMNVGRWMGAWIDRFLGADLFAPGMLGTGSAAAFSRWQLVVFSQCLALGFFAGAVAVALLRVTFTDLAFGWSTTLDMDPRTVHVWVAALAAPWAPWLPEAAPDLALVEASRYFRLEEGRMALERVEQLGTWWPFVLMTVLVYGALPRLVLLVVGLWRLRRATAALLLDDAEVTALLDRLDTPVVDPGAGGEEDVSPDDAAEVPPPREPLAAEGLLLMIWNGAVAADAARDWLARHLGVAPAAVLETGILQSEAERRTRLRDVGGQEGRIRRVVLVTKGWEPPLLEFVDFLALVREELGADCSITVVPLDVSGTRIRPDDRSVWAHALARARDPRLYVMEAA
ncbi:MAG TPA: DUF2868 domain-containing protein [Pseudomonadales bacterium]